MKPSEWVVYIFVCQHMSVSQTKGWNIAYMIHTYTILLEVADGITIPV